MQQLAVLNKVPKLVVVPPNKYLPTPKTTVLPSIESTGLHVIVLTVHEDFAPMFEQLVALNKHAIGYKQNIFLHETHRRWWYFFPKFAEVPLVTYHIEYVNRKDLEEGLLHTVKKFLWEA